MNFTGRVLIVFLLLSIILTSCSSSTGNSLPTSERLGIGTQDIWIFDSFRRFDESGAVIDITDQIVDEAMRSLGNPVTINPNMTFKGSTQLEGRVLDENGDLIPNISLEFGVLEYGERDLLVAISSANLDEALVNLDQNDFVEIDFTFIDELEIGENTEMDYIFAQTIVPDDMSEEDGLSNLEIFANRWNSGNLAFLGIEVDDEIRISEMYGQGAIIIEGSKFWRYAGKAMTVTGDTIWGGAQGVIGGGATGGGLGLGIGLLGGPFAAVTAPVGGAWGGAIGVVFGGWAGTIGGFLSSAGAALERNNPPAPPPPPLQQATATPPPPTATSPPPVTPSPTPMIVMVVDEPGDCMSPAGAIVDACSVDVIGIEYVWDPARQEFYALITFESDPLQAASIEFPVNTDNDQQTGFSWGQYIGIDHRWWFEGSENGLIYHGPGGDQEAVNIPGAGSAYGNPWRVWWGLEDILFPPLPGQSYWNPNKVAISIAPMESRSQEAGFSTIIIGLEIWDYGVNGQNMVIEQVAPVEFTLPTSIK